MTVLRAVIVLAGFLAMTLVLMPVQALLRCVAPSWARMLPHCYHSVLARILGYTISVQGAVPKGPALLASNHVSWIDIVAISSILPVSFIAKREVRQWPLFGWMARLQGTVFIDRKRRHQAADARDDIQKRLAGGDVLVLFPEGTSSDGQSLLAFKPALFGAAEGGGTPVIPVTLVYMRARGLPMTRRQRPFYAWYGGMDLVTHLWQSAKLGPVDVGIVFRPALKARSRKEMAREAEAVIRADLAGGNTGNWPPTTARFSATGKCASRSP